MDGHCDICAVSMRECPVWRCATCTYECHQDCALRWFRQSDTCPQCRQRVSWGGAWDPRVRSAIMLTLLVSAPGSSIEAQD